MSELDVQGLTDLHRKRIAAASQWQPRVQTAYWQGRIDEFIAQNAVNEQEQAHALSISAWEDETFIPRTESVTTWGDSDQMRASGPQGIVLDGTYYAIDRDEMTGAEIRALPNPSIRDDCDLFITAEGQMDVKVDYDERILARARVFITAPRFINGG